MSRVTEEEFRMVENATECGNKTQSIMAETKIIYFCIVIILIIIIITISRKGGDDDDDDDDDDGDDDDDDDDDDINSVIRVLMRTMQNS